LFGYDFRVEYHPGRLNTVADALSRHDSEELSLSAISSPTFQNYDNIKQEIDASTELYALRDTISRASKVFVPTASPLLLAVLL
jgi:hypothetical protein